MKHALAVLHIAAATAEANAAIQEQEGRTESAQDATLMASEFRRAIQILESDQADWFDQFKLAMMQETGLTRDELGKLNLADFIGYYLAGNTPEEAATIEAGTDAD